MATLTKAREKSGLWFIKQFSGVLVFVLIIVHLLVNHFVSPNGLLTYQEVIAYLGNPWIAAMEITFLIVVTGHALLGVRSILLDLNPTKRVLSIIDPLLVVIGVIAAGYGIWLTMIIVGRAL
jgi:succinate dehydrogenase / fumarate reductase membrane anchor subunit